MQETPVWFLGREDPLENERLPTPEFWPREFHGLYSPQGHKESDMTEWLSLTHSVQCDTPLAIRSTEWLSLKTSKLYNSVLNLNSFLNFLLHGQETWVGSLGWEDSLGEGQGYLLQDSGLENSLDCIVCGVTKSRTRLSELHFHFNTEKALNVRERSYSWHFHYSILL